LLDDGLLAFAIARRKHRTSVRLGLLLPWRQAAVALSRHRRCFGIDLLEVLENGGDGAAHVIDIEPVEAGQAVEVRNPLVVPAHPFDQGRDVEVAPHPGGESLKGGASLLRVLFSSV
jgi:hypothetical protein